MLFLQRGPFLQQDALVARRLVRSRGGKLVLLETQHAALQLVGAALLQLGSELGEPGIEGGGGGALQRIGAALVLLVNGSQSLVEL
jgi:hypothetical protein